MSPLFVALLLSYAVIGVLFFALVWMADRLDAARRRSNPIPTVGVEVSALPVASVHRPTAWRRKFLRPTTNNGK